MSLKYIPAGAAMMAVLLTSACSSDTDVVAPSADTSVAATDTWVPQTASVETAPPSVETIAPPSTPESTPAPVPAATAPQQAGQVPSVMRRTTADAPAQQVTATFPPRVTVIQLREMVDEGGAVIVDSRDRVSYAIEHIPGSINIPAQESTTRAGELPKGKTIVTYCA